MPSLGLLLEKYCLNIDSSFSFSHHFSRIELASFLCLAVRSASRKTAFACNIEKQTHVRENRFVTKLHKISKARLVLYAGCEADS